MFRLDPHKTSMLSMLNSARLFSVQPATSLSSHPACSLSSRPPLPSTSTPRDTAQLETPERQSLTSLDSRCPIKILTPTRTRPLVSVPSPCTMPCDLCLLYWDRAIEFCHVTNTPIYINVFEFCILQSIIYIGESTTCHNVMSRHRHTDIYKCL